MTNDPTQNEQPETIQPSSQQIVKTEPLKQEETKPDSPKPKTRWILRTFLSLLIFLSGIVIGVMMVTSVIQNRIQAFQFVPEKMTNHVMQRIERRYDLTDEQTIAIRKVTLKHMEQLEKVGQETQPRLQSIFESFTNNVASEMTPQQAAEWQARSREVKERFLPKQAFRKQPLPQKENPSDDNPTNGKQAEKPSSK